MFNNLVRIERGVCERKDQPMAQNSDNFYNVFIILSDSEFENDMEKRSETGNIGRRSQEITNET